jgi:hypothetical protein
MNRYNEEDIKNELRSLFLLREDNSSPFLLVTSKDYPCYYISRDGWKGVGIVVGSELINFSYKFENIRVKVVPELIANENVYMLELLTNRDFDLYNFAIICLDFLNPGENGISRQRMMEDPQLWIDSWRDLLGNRFSEEKVYPFCISHFRGTGSFAAVYFRLSVCGLIPFRLKILLSGIFPKNPSLFWMVFKVHLINSLLLLSIPCVIIKSKKLAFANCFQ